MLAEAHIQAAVVCDEIRQEMSGKLILIGLTYGDWTVPHFPFSLRFMIHVEGIISRAGQYSPYISVRDVSDGLLYHQKVYQNDPTFNLGRFAAAFSVQIQLQRPGLISIYHLATDKQQLIIQRNVEVAYSQQTFPPKV